MYVMIVYIMPLVNSDRQASAAHHIVGTIHR